jgi:hypothetical protein
VSLTLASSSPSGNVWEWGLCAERVGRTPLPQGKSRPVCATKRRSILRRLSQARSSLSSSVARWRGKLVEIAGAAPCRQATIANRRQRRPASGRAELWDHAGSSLSPLPRRWHWLASCCFRSNSSLGSSCCRGSAGSATTWIVCLLFFQVALLAGYALASCLVRYLSLLQQIAVELAILGSSLLLLPVTPYESWKPATADDPTWCILALLSTSVGLPYVALATTTPLLTRWIAQFNVSLAPSRFFAASNLGSCCGLLSYPFAVEHLLSTLQQAHWWSRGYILYATLLTSAPFWH